MQRVRLDPWTEKGPLTDALVRELTPPEASNRVRQDGRLGVAGFGVRVTAANAKAFVLRYRNASGRDRILTIGSYPDWNVAKAREQARKLKREIDTGSDPLADRETQRSAPDVNDLCDQFVAEHFGRLRASSAHEYSAMIDHYIRPALGTQKVAALRHADVAKLHRTISAHAPYRANRCIAVLSSLISFAIKQEYRSDNPTRGVQRNAEHRRERFLQPNEIAALSETLAAYPVRAAANCIRLLLLTGARLNEVLSATWDQFDLRAGVWTKPASNTKQKRTHRVPLSAAAMALLSEMETTSDYLFPSPAASQPLSGTAIRKHWVAICESADIKSCRIHDLRHSFASVLASAGLSLPVIGALLGHTQAATTARYSHLLDDTLRAATETAASVISGSAGKVVPFRKRR
jgi:integrase